MGEYNETPVLRDVQVAQEIRDMAALGKFPKEITVYGLVYYKDQQRQYMISSDPAKLIYFLNDTINQQYFPTPIASHSERLMIPEGYEEEMIQSMKLHLAKIMQKLYPLEVFERLAELDSVLPNTSLEQPLWQYRQQLESEFSKGKIRAFSALCTKSYLRKNISLFAYQSLTAWCEKRVLQLEQHVPPSSTHEKSFYGLAVLAEHQVNKCVINANLNCIYQEKMSLEKQGFLTTIWHKKTFQVERQESLQGIVDQMKAVLEDIYDSEMLQLIEQIEQAPNVVSADQLKNVCTDTTAEKGRDLVRFYGRLWGIKNGM